MKNSKSISNVSMTKCHKGGIKIKETNNNYNTDPFANINPFNAVQEKKREDCLLYTSPSPRD